MAAVEGENTYFYEVKVYEVTTVANGDFPRCGQGGPWAMFCSFYFVVSTATGVPISRHQNESPTCHSCEVDRVIFVAELDACDVCFIFCAGLRGSG